MKDPERTVLWSKLELKISHDLSVQFCGVWNFQKNVESVKLIFVMTVIKLNFDKLK